MGNRSGLGQTQTRLRRSPGRWSRLQTRLPRKEGGRRANCSLPQIDVEKSKNSCWSLKSVCISYVTFIALLLGIDSSASLMKEHFKQFLCRFCVNVCLQIKLVESETAKRNEIKWQAEVTKRKK